MEDKIFVFEMYGLFTKNGEKVGSVVSIEICKNKKEALKKIEKPQPKKPRMIFQGR